MPSTRTSTLNLGIMQPYFLPYLGYFQLVAAVDHFVLLDDAAFIKKGWIHRNRILLSGEPHLFSIPIRDASQHRSIKDTCVADDDSWRPKLEKTIVAAYRKAPCFDQGMGIFRQTMTCSDRSIARLAEHSIRVVATHLGIGTTIDCASTALPNTSGARAEDRIIEICRANQATRYINPIGGTELYHEERFRSEGMELLFLRSKGAPYVQGNIGIPFVPHLSILDALMFLDVAAIRSLLETHELLSPSQAQD